MPAVNAARAPRSSLMYLERSRVCSTLAMRTHYLLVQLQPQIHFRSFLCPVSLKPVGDTEKWASEPGEMAFKIIMVIMYASPVGASGNHS